MLVANTRGEFNPLLTYPATSNALTAAFIVVSIPSNSCSQPEALASSNGEHENTVHQQQVELNLTRFYNIYDELQERVLDIASKRVMFNPNFNFGLSDILIACPTHSVSKLKKECSSILKNGLFSECSEFPLEHHS